MISWQKPGKLHKEGNHKIRRETQTDGIMIAASSQALFTVEWKHKRSMLSCATYLLDAPTAETGSQTGELLRTVCT